MSKSFKKNPVVKNKGWDKDNYWRRVRGATKNILRSKDISELEEVPLPNPKEIVNDYEYNDWISKCMDDSECYCMRNFGNRDKCKRK
jgi:hypothetical protein